MDQKDPFLVVPGWWRSSSGLLLPSTVARPPMAPAVRVPEELHQKPRPVAVGDFERSDLEQIAVYVDEAALQIEASSLSKIRDVVSEVNFEAGMLALAHIGAKVFALRGGREQQLRMARESFPTPFIQLIESFFLEHANAELFAEQQVFILQRLLVERAAWGTVPHELSDQERLILALGLIACGSIIESTSERAVKQARGLEDWLAFFVQNGAYNDKRSPMGELSRAQYIWCSGWFGGEGHRGRSMAMPAQQR